MTIHCNFKDSRPQLLSRLFSLPLESMLFLKVFITSNGFFKGTYSKRCFTTTFQRFSCVLFFYPKEQPREEIWLRAKPSWIVKCFFFLWGRRFRCVASRLKFTFFIEKSLSLQNSRQSENKERKTGKPDVLRSRFLSVLLHHFLTIDSFIYDLDYKKFSSFPKLVSNVQSRGCYLTQKVLCLRVLDFVFSLKTLDTSISRKICLRVI